MIFLKKINKKAGLTKWVMSKNEQKPDGLTIIEKISSSDWAFVPEQWQVQMWAKVFEKLGPEGQLFICAAQLENSDSSLIPGINVSSQTKSLPDEDIAAYTTRITQQTINELLGTSPNSSVLVLPDGPYAVPVFKKHI